MNIRQRNGFLALSAGFLLVLLAISLGLAYWAGLKPLSQIHWNVRDGLLGMAAGLGLAFSFSGFSSVRQQAEDAIGESLAQLTWYDMLLLAGFVGVIEELVFRGVLQPWIAQLDPWLGFLLANAIFGAFHALSWKYAVLATILGCLMSLLAYGVGDDNLLRPMIAHAVYDWIGFHWIASRVRARTPGAESTH